MKLLSLIADRCRFQTPAACTLFAMLLIAGSPRANASTYSFGFQAGDLLSALSVSDAANDNFPNRAYFAIFLQPDSSTLPLGQYSFSSLGSPIPAGPDQWQAITVTDPSNAHLPAGTWAAFSKLPQQNWVTVLGVNNNPYPANPEGFIGLQYSDTGLSPYSFGQSGTPATITGLMSSVSEFSFLLNTDLNLGGGSYTFFGYASAIDNADYKTFERIQFEIQLTPRDVSTPEPGTLLLLFSGVALFGGWEARKRLRHRRDPGSANKPV